MIFTIQRWGGSTFHNVGIIMATAEVQPDPKPKSARQTTIVSKPKQDAANAKAFFNSIFQTLR